MESQPVMLFDVDSIQEFSMSAARRKMKMAVQHKVAQA